MKYHLEHEIHLAKEAKYESLYAFYLQEKSAEGKWIGDKCIPWGWTARFSATDLTFYLAVEQERTALGEVDSSTSGSERIVGQLRSDEKRGRTGREYPCRYSMFGTDRSITNIVLEVARLKAEVADERCAVHGYVSYTDDVDFHDETESDALYVCIYLRPSSFDKLAHQVQSQQIDNLSVGIGRVDGFYSEWSPSISTDHVKVLADGREQAVIADGEFDFTPPRLGSVGSFQLVATRRATLSSEVVPVDEPDDVGDEVEPIQSEREIAVQSVRSLEKLTEQVVRSQDLIRALRVPLWIGVVLLLVLIFTH
jgi:hypothetical protein